jgi:DNA-binding NarL/FixJ family response regulator
VEDLVRPETEERDEAIMKLLIEGFTSAEVAKALGLYSAHVRTIKSRMCRKAETHIQLARLKLWREDVQRAA